MDDRTFNNASIASPWIESIESEQSSQIRSRDIYPQLNAWVNKYSPQRILEIGCGQGACAFHMELLNQEYIGIDPCSIMIGRANELKKGTSLKFELGNAYSLPYEDGSFDGVFSVAVWHLLSGIKEAAKELSRVLRPGGRFLIITANPKSYDAWVSFYALGKLSGKRFEGESLGADGSKLKDTLFFHNDEEIEGSLSQGNLFIEEKTFFRPVKEPSEKHYYVTIQGQKG